MSGSLKYIQVCSFDAVQIWNGQNTYELDYSVIEQILNQNQQVYLRF